MSYYLLQSSNHEVANEEKNLFMKCINLLSNTFSTAISLKGEVVK
jgi:hypothetical protein